MKYVWQDELQKFAGLHSEVLQGKTPYQPAGKIWIINYEILASSHLNEAEKRIFPWVLALLRTEARTLILDECHYIKERRSQRTQACKLLSKQMQYIQALSGTPITNRPVEFFPVLNIVAPQTFPSFWEYAFRYCDPKPGFRGRGWDFRGASNIEELHKLSSQHIIRRTKEEVLPELPKKTRIVIPVEITNRREYKTAEDHFLHWLGINEGGEAVKRARKAEALVKLGKLQEIAARGKLPVIRKWIEDWLEETEEKLVVFTTHRTIISELRKAFPMSAMIDGSVSNIDREKEKRRFQEDKKCRLFFGSIKAAGVGLTLTASSTVLFIELGWTPAVHDQAEDRVLRIGQTSKKVLIYYMIGKETVEESILSLIERKRKVIGQVVDGREILETILRRQEK